MKHRVLVAGQDGTIVESSDVPNDIESLRWMWIDVVAQPDDLAELMELSDRYHFDRLAVRDAATDGDLPKVDDFGTHLLVVVHGLGQDRLGTDEIDCFLSAPGPAHRPGWFIACDRVALGTVLRAG